MSKNSVRTSLRNDLMSFSAIVNRIDSINDYLTDYQQERKNKGKLSNDVDLSYSFLNFARTKVYVFGGLLLDKKSFSEDTMFNLLCAITELPQKDFEQSIRNGKEWIKNMSLGYEGLIKSYNDFEAAKVEAAKVEVKKIEDLTNETAKVEPKRRKAKAA